MFRFKTVVAVISVATMIGSSAFAADGALSPGKPAGVKPAMEIGTGTLLIGLGVVAVVTGVAIVVADQSGDRVSTSTFAPASTTSVAP